VRDWVRLVTSDDAPAVDGTFRLNPSVPAVEVSSIVKDAALSVLLSFSHD
jgi:hypothetical protein